VAAREVGRPPRDLLTLRKKRADLSHLWLDPLIVAGPWLLAGWLAAAKLKKLRQHRTS
jgi:hypothetical protein